MLSQKKREGMEKNEVEKLTAKVEDIKRKTGVARLTAEKKRAARKALEDEEKVAWDKFVKAREAAGNMSWSKVPSDPVDKARFMLKKEEIEFDRCKQQLEAAHKKLDEAQKDYEHNVAEQKKLGEQVKVKLDKEADEEENKAKTVKQREGKEREAAGVAAKEEEDEVKKASAADTTAHAAKSKLNAVGDAVSAAKKKVEKSEADLQKAECALRRYRNEKPCEDEAKNDEHEMKKSDSESLKHSIAVALFVSLASAF